MGRQRFRRLQNGPANCIELAKSKVKYSASLSRSSNQIEAIKSRGSKLRSTFKKFLSNLKNEVQAFRCLLACVTVVIYLNSLRCGFVYDDRPAILENRNVLSIEWQSWFRLFTDDFWGTPVRNVGSHKSYRPLVTLSFKLEAHLQQLWSAFSNEARTKVPSAFSYHLVNLLLHLSVVDLLVRISLNGLAIDCLYSSRSARQDSKKLADNQRVRGYEREAPPKLDMVPCVAALLFACHPIHVEAVTSLVGRAELMGALFALMSFKGLREHLLQVTEFDQKPPVSSCDVGQPSGSHLLGKSVLFAALGCLCKENCAAVIPLNLILIIWFALKSRSATKRNLSNHLEVRSLLAMSILLALFGALRVQLANNQPGDSPSGLPILPKFSITDNPLAQDAHRFCLSQPAQYAEQSPFSDLREFPAANSNIVQARNCSNQADLKEISRWMLLTKLYLPAFNLKLLVYPTELSYDWSLSAIGLITDSLDLRVLLAAILYTSICLFFILWLAELCDFSLILRSVLVSLFRTAECWLDGKRLAREKSLQLPTSGSASEDSGCDETCSLRSVDTNGSIDSGFMTDSNTSKSQYNGRARPNRPVRDKRSNEVEAQRVRATALDCIGWPLLWLTIPYLPASNLLLPVGFLAAERTLYLPSFGFCLLMANLLHHLPLPGISLISDGWCGPRGLRKVNFKAANWTQNGFCGQKRAIETAEPTTTSQASGNTDGYTTAKLLLIFPLLILGGLKTVRRNEDWRDELALYSSNLGQSSARSLANLASLSALQLVSFQAFAGEPSPDLDRWKTTEQLYRRALQLEPHSPELHYNL